MYMDMMNKSERIGIFDSGFGGLNIMKGIVQELPQFDYVYLGDTARVPYGNRSKEVIHTFTRQAVEFLFAHRCTLVILACNTASADALRKIQRDYLPKRHPGKKVLGVLIPGAEHAAMITRNRRIGVIATDAAVKSKAFARELKKVDSRLNIFQCACPLLVPIVESGRQDSEMADIALQIYLQPLLAEKIDTLILGCTHYGILEGKIREIVGKEVTVINESAVVAEKLKDYLRRHPEIETKIGKTAKRIYYCTDLTDNFVKVGSALMGSPIRVKQARIC